MTKLPLAAGVLALLATTPVLAHSNEARLAEQAAMIEAGRADGSITWAEGIKLRREQAEIRRVMASFEVDGQLSRGEKLILFRMQDAAEEHIRAEAGDRWHRIIFMPRVLR